MSESFEGIAKHAIDILESSYGLKHPRRKELSDGTVGAYWKLGALYATVEFEEDGEHVWTVSNGTKCVSGVWDVNKPAPMQFVAIARLC